MKRLYHHLVEHRWGEPADLIVYDRSRAAVPGALEQLHVAIWDADESCDISTFMTLGMSELPMPHGDYRAELTLGFRGELSREDRGKLTTLLANVAEYPFGYDRRLDWWERLVRPGAIPAFPGCEQLLLAPMFGERPFERFPAPDDDVKVLSVVTVTPREAHILKEHGRTAFLDYWEEEGVDLYSPRTDPPTKAG
jgi:hypothetical protein